MKIGLRRTNKKQELKIAKYVIIAYGNIVIIILTYNPNPNEKQY